MIVNARAMGAAATGTAQPVWLVAAVLALAPLVFLPAQVDFAELPQQLFIQAAALGIALWASSRRELRDRLLRREVRSLDLALVSFIACSLVSLALAPERQAGVRVLAHWAACGVAYLAVSRLSTIGDVRWLARGALLGAAAVACVGLGQAVFHFSGVPQAAGPSGTMANRDLAAAYLLAVAPLAMLAGRRRRWPALVALALLIAFLPVTRSRAAALALALQLAVLIWVLVARGWVRRVRLGLAGVAVGLALATLGVAAGLGWTLTDTAKGRSLGIRWDLAASALQMGVDHPWTGVGLGRFEAAYPAYGPPVSGEFGVLHVEHPHAEPLEVFAESGLPGLLALAWIACSVVSVLVRLARSSSPWHRRAALALGLSVIALGVDAMSGFPLRTALAPLVLALVLGLCSRLDRAAVPLPASPVLGPARWLAWTAGPVAALIVAGAVALSLVRLVGDHALREMALAERDGRYAAAVAAGRVAARLDPRPTVLLALARAELRVGHRDAALSLLDRVLSARPYDATAVATLGSARWAAGDREGARVSWRLARQLGVGLPVILPRVAPIPAHSSSTSACTGRVTVSVASDGGVALVAHAELLSDVLKCVGSRTGLRIDYDGPAPRQRITVEIASGPLPSTLASLFEGLGLNYVLSTGAGQVGGGDRLIVSGVSGGPAPRPASSTDQPGLEEPSFDEPPSPMGPEGRSGFSEPDQPYTGGPGQPYSPPQVGPSEPTAPAPSHPSTAEPSTEPPPEFPQPGQLTPTVRHWEPWPPVARVEPVRGERRARASGG